MKKIIFSVIAATLFLHSPLRADEQEPPRGSGKKVIVKSWSAGLKSGGSKKKFYPEAASVLADGSQVLVGTHSSIFYSLDQSTGKKQWQFDSDGPIASQAVADDRAVYFGNNEGMVYALDRRTGVELWKHYVGAEVLSAPAQNSQAVFFQTSSREIVALDKSQGGELWSAYIRGYDRKITMRGLSSLTYAGDRLFAGFSDGQIVCVGASSGQVQWTQTIGSDSAQFKDVDGQVLAEGGSLYAVGYGEALVSMSQSTGQVLWKTSVKSGSNMLLDNGRLYISSRDGRLMSVDKNSGRRQWDVSLYSGDLSSPGLLGDYILVGSETGKMFVFDKQQGKVAQVLSVPGGFLGHSSTNNEKLFILTGTGSVQALKVL